jgi:RNA recognition motif-containing protein
VSEEELLNFFENFYISVMSAKLIVDPVTKASRCYAFIKMKDNKEYNKAIKEMNGKLLMGCPMKVK